MSNDILDTLLADIPAEEVVDERIGVYSVDTSRLAESVVVSFNQFPDGQTGYSLRARFALTNDKGDHTIDQFISIPNKSSEPWVKQVELGWLHSFGLVPFTSKNAPVLPDFNGDNEADRRDIVEKIAAAFNTKVGEGVAVVVYAAKNGYTNVRPNRSTKK